MSVTEFKKETPLFSVLCGKGRKHLFIITERGTNGNTYSNNKEWVLNIPCRGEGFFRPFGRWGISAMKMAGPLHPPFSLFLLEEKKKTGRARSKREKEVTARGGRGTAAE
jgi:hypothetical protein